MLKLLGTKVMVEVAPESEVSKSGIIIKETKSSGKVKLVGEGVEGLKAGMEILYAPSKNYETYSVEGVDCILIDFDDILAVIEGGE